uniref:DUF4139 domain-containing protein n=1 Tax=Parerythrobacter lutipelagi TaxID=1964208 RepID=UPI0010F53A88|nr:hypothetical protein [Parerythrobacter lutipelagi]
MHRWLPALAGLLAIFAAPARGDTPIVVSQEADDVAVTFYREPGRHFDTAMEVDFDDPEQILGGYAMIAETRTVTIPPGEVTVRFEGVASGIEPQSAILLNGDLKEKNFDSRLLSQRGLIDAFYGQVVTILYTDPATGERVSEPATIMTFPDDALVLKTAKGYVSAVCDGTIDTLLFPNVPKDLTAKPTLSMLTRPDNPGGSMTVTLVYLAMNFDWQASYVGTFSPDGQSLKLAGWMTLASKDRTTFDGAEVSAIAGQVSRATMTEEEEEAFLEERENDPYGPDNIELGYSCWPQGRTAVGQDWPVLFGPGSLPEKGKPIQVSYGYGGGYYGDDQDGAYIVVTGSRIARRDDVGDLKLYTLPFRSGVPAQSLKQVRFLQETEIEGETIYLAEVSGDEINREFELAYRFRNRKRSGLGEPMPGGQIALFQMTQAGRQLVGETNFSDKAVDEEVVIRIPDDDIFLDLDIDSTDKEGDDWEEKELTVENDFEWPVTVEIEFSDNLDYDRLYSLSGFSRRVARKDGKYVWKATIPAEGEAKIRYRVTETEVPVFDE